MGSGMAGSPWKTPLTRDIRTQWTEVGKSAEKRPGASAAGFCLGSIEKEHRGSECSKWRRKRSLGSVPAKAFQPCCVNCGHYSHFSVAFTAPNDAVQVGNKEGLDRGTESQPVFLGPTLCNLSMHIHIHSSGQNEDCRWEIVPDGSGHRSWKDCPVVRSVTCERPPWGITATVWNHGALCAVMGPVEVRLGIGASEEILPVYVAEMEDPCLLGLNYLTKVGACVDLQDWMLRVLGDKVPLSFGVGSTGLFTAECVSLAPETKFRVSCESTKKTAGSDGTVESLGPMKHVDDPPTPTVHCRIISCEITHRNVEHHCILYVTEIRSYESRIRNHSHRNYMKIWIGYFFVLLSLCASLKYNTTH